MNTFTGKLLFYFKVGQLPPFLPGLDELNITVALAANNRALTDLPIKNLKFIFVGYLLCYLFVAYVLCNISTGLNPMVEQSCTF